MKLSDAKSKGIFRKVVNIGDFFEGMKEKDVWIKLREPTTQEAENLKTDSSLAEVRKVLQSCIEDHNFEDEQGAKATPADVMELVSSSSGMFTKVLSEWQESLPLMRQTGQK